jgi:hypothetical protein
MMNPARLLGSGEASTGACYIIREFGKYNGNVVINNSIDPQRHRRM